MKLYFQTYPPVNIYEYTGSMNLRLMMCQQLRQDIKKGALLVIIGR